MNRLPTILAAAFSVAASFTAFVAAGPSSEATEPRSEPNPLAGAPVAAPGGAPATISLDASRHLGFGENELVRRPEGALPDTIRLPTDLTSQASVDVSDFISPSWLEVDAQVLSFSTPLARAEDSAAAEPAAIASSEVTMLSVPEVPLPPALIPGLAGVALALVMHRRSLKHSKLPK